MKKTKFKLALTAATTAVVMLSGVTAGNAAEFRLAAQQPTIAGEINTDIDATYLVRLADPAIATYEGGIAGLPATSAKATGKQRLDTKSSAAKKYKKHLEKQQTKVLKNARSALGRNLDAKYTYQYATNGFAVLMTADEAKAMRSMAGVVSVQRERMESLQTDAGPAWIGAPEIWGKSKKSKKSKNAKKSAKEKGSMGEGVVVAILDSGINSDHDSFAAKGGDKYKHKNPLGKGNYIPGSYCDAVDASFCNDKLIGAWDFDLTDGSIPEDENGHGSHVASTVAGNVVRNAFIDAPTTTAYFDISGVAPHANIIVYDVCHTTPEGQGTCPGAALAQAIDQVLIDAGNLPNGIAALNYSISGGGDPYNDYVELGFLAAVDAGVYVAASAGNSGPDASTVAHLGPWVSTTAASTHNRRIVNTLIDIDSDSSSTPDIGGLGLTSGYGPATIVNSADYEKTHPGATLCGVGALGDEISPWPPGFFNGEIVACTRGTFGRVEKGMNVLAAGAGGMVLMDNGSGLVGDPHVLPAVHISQADGATLSAWLAANALDDSMATIEGYSFNTDPANGDVMADFSSRGPQLAFDVLKPDVTAPGVSIMGADADVFAQYQIISGTSMS
ncbi:MAG: S8 family serine peptidase, partial [Xanthomonadales bacterium]|nr:S8 family serine peptidase [Xanthomonadales bacterium]